ncbi:MAG: hypothetical protein QOG34_961 [Frankiaceae bacterium]|jgi:hypothetical protein|nr:hypothetical protein [Frankiaceae bacterium]
MRSRALVIAAALLAGSAATVSAAPSTTRPTTHPRTALGLHADDFRTAATLRAARMRVLAEHRKAAPSAGLTAPAQQPIWGYGNGESGLPDVDGDGVGDVLSSRLYARKPALKVLSGRTGRTLWSVPSPTDTLAAVYIPAPGGKSVMLVLTETVTGQETPVGGGEVDAFTVKAVNPKTGASVWSTTITGLIEDDPSGLLAAGLGEFDGALMRKNTTPYLLLDRFTLHFDGLTFTTSVAPLVIDATTGSTVDPGAPEGGDEFTFATPVGDLNGDGIDDYLICAGGDVPSTAARSGATGQPLWTTNGTAYAFLVSLVPSPDLTGDHKADLLLGWYDGGEEPVVHAINGATGADVWTAAGDFGLPIGDIDHDGRSDTRVYVGGLRLTFSAIGGTGKRLWSRDVLSPSGTHGWAWDAGDMDGDHYADAYVEFVPSKGDTSAKAAATVSGRNGKSHAIPDLGIPLRVSLRGGAPSFVRGVAGKKGYTLTAYDGRSHRAFWRTMVKSADVQRISMLDVVDLGHGRTGLLALLTGRFDNTVVLFDGRHGNRLWTSVYETPGEDDQVIFE